MSERTPVTQAGALGPQLLGNYVTEQSRRKLSKPAFHLNEESLEDWACVRSIETTFLGRTSLSLVPSPTQVGVKGWR